VAYNAVCFLQEFVQILNTKDIRLDWLHIMLDQDLVEYGGDVHCCAADLELAGMK